MHHLGWLMIHSRWFGVHHGSRRDEANHADRIGSGRHGAAILCVHFGSVVVQFVSLERGHCCRLN